MSDSQATLVGQIILGIITIGGLLLKEWRDVRSRKCAADKVAATFDATTLLQTTALRHANDDMMAHLDVTQALTRDAAAASKEAAEAANNFNRKWSAFTAAEIARVSDREVVSQRDQVIADVKTVVDDTNARVRDLEIIADGSEPNTDA